MLLCASNYYISTGRLCEEPSKLIIETRELYLDNYTQVKVRYIKRENIQELK